MLPRSVTLPFFLCAIAHAGARFFSGRVVPPGRNEYLQPAASRPWSPEEAITECEADPECAGFTMRGPVKSPEKRRVAFFRYQNK